MRLKELLGNGSNQLRLNRHKTPQPCNSSTFGGPSCDTSGRRHFSTSIVCHTGFAKKSRQRLQETRSGIVAADLRSPDVGPFFAVVDSTGQVTLIIPAR